MMRVRWDPGNQSLARGSAKGAVTSGRTAFPGSFVPAAGREQDGRFVSCPEERLLVCLRGRGCLFAPAEVGFLDPHAMQDGRQRACACELGAFHAASFGDLHRPDLEARIRRRLAQDDVRRLVQRGADRLVADATDPAIHIHLAGLELSGCHAKMRAHR